MKATAMISGDPSVGIWSKEYQLDFGDLLDPEVKEDPEIRQYAREQLESCFSVILDQPVGLVWEDECPDCMEVDGHKEGCPTQEPEDLEGNPQ